MKIKFLWVFVLSVFFFGVAKGQINVEIVDNVLSSSHETSHLEQKIIHVLAGKNKKKTVFNVDSEGRLDLIVEFVDPPLVVQQQAAKLQGKQSMKVDQSRHNRRFDQFQKDVEEITSHNRIRSSGKGGAQRAKPASIHRKYSRAFSGVHLKLSSSHDIEAITSLPYVKNIYNNYKITVNLPKKAKKTHADQVRQQLAYSGKGVTVAIIDTGIDYTHPALGGGLGEGYKVIGGYDFMNEDEDPMDDMGHGTHVAGIVAANSAIMQGVAPDARLVAYKVLDSTGAGTVSNIIAAIERTIDPNMDGDFSDRIDVVNISLGSDFGGPDDPASRAVDAGVAAGVVFVLAAGNAGGMGFHTIGTPSAAKSAITVGASEQDQLAWFSSKGPNRGSYGIKPEVVGPGVDIMSTYLLGEYQTFSGTSMAAPYVAGVAALIKERHPDEKPAHIKSLITGSAESLNEEIMAQGAGLVNALGALNSETTALPSTLNFGLNSKNSPHWIVRKKIKIVNNSNKKQRYKVSAKDLPSGVKLMAFPRFFRLSPGKSKKINVFLWAKNRRVPFPEKGSLAYSGLLKVKSKDDVINIPWSFVRAAEVELNFDEDFPRFTIFNNKYWRGKSSADVINSNTFSLIMPPGAYDIVSTLGNKIHIAEQKMVKGVRKYDINFSEAVHTIDMAGVDHNGTLFSALSPSMYISGIHMLPPEGSLLKGISMGGEARGEFASKWLFSPVSERYKFLAGEMHVTDKLAYVVNYPPINGIYGDVSVVANEPNEFFMSKIHVQVPPNKREKESSVSFDAELLPNWVVIGESAPVDSDVWNGTLYMTPQVYDNTFKFSASVRATLPAPTPDFGGNPEFVPFSEPTFWLRTLPFYFVNNKVGSFSGAEPLTTTYMSESDLTFGLLPLYGKISSSNNLVTESSQIEIRPLYSGPLDEQYLPLAWDSTISIYNEQGIMQSSEPVGANYFKDLMPAKYTYELSSVEGEYVVGNKPGQVTYIAHIDLSLEDANPPAFTSLRLADESGQPIGNITQGEPASLSFSVADLQMVLDDESQFPRVKYQSMDQNNVKLFVREWSSETWQPVALTYIAEDSVGVIGADPVGHIYSADFSDLGMKGEISFMISAEDRSGNIAEWMMEPGFSVSEE